MKQSIAIGISNEAGNYSALKIQAVYQRGDRLIVIAEPTINKEHTDVAKSLTDNVEVETNRDQELEIERYVYLPPEQAALVEDQKNIHHYEDLKLKGADCIYGTDVYKRKDQAVHHKNYFVMTLSQFALFDMKWWRRSVNANPLLWGVGGFMAIAGGLFAMQRFGGQLQEKISQAFTNHPTPKP